MMILGENDTDLDGADMAVALDMWINTNRVMADPVVLHMEEDDIEERLVIDVDDIDVRLERELPTRDSLGKINSGIVVRGRVTAVTSTVKRKRKWWQFWKRK